MKKSKVYWLFLLPSLLGVLLFYAIPFAFSLHYALVDNMGSLQFVGLRNFADTLTNSLFQSAARNTIIFIVLSVPLSMALSLFLSLCLQGMKKGRVPHRVHFRKFLHERQRDCQPLFGRDSADKRRRLYLPRHPLCTVRTAAQTTHS